MVPRSEPATRPLNLRCSWQDSAPENAMTKIEQLMQERDDLKAKITSAERSSHSSARATSDLKMMEQELLALEQRISRQETGEGETSRQSASLAEKMERKLDAALADSFPGSDPVSFLEAKPVKKGDESLPEVKAAKR
jgi:predicted RNase H-like nuclease (RuvC/YqgF family)